MITAISLMITMVIVHLIKYQLKKKMMEAGVSEDPVIGSEKNKSKAEPRNILKWTLIMMFGGVGLIVQEFLPYNSDNSALPYGVEILFISIGVLIYYLIIKNDNKNK